LKMHFSIFPRLMCRSASVGVIDNGYACRYLLQHEGRSATSHAHNLR
jgi:hypothetical protein